MQTVFNNGGEYKEKARELILLSEEEVERRYKEERARHQYWVEINN